jgi:tRNA U34 5-carboxymethylaminomethyl modifying GTPase MnmE/TrmE
MLRLTALCAASAIALSAIATVSPAQAAFHVIKWSGTEACQVWDDGVPTKPFPSNYTAVSKRVGSFDGALAVKAGLMKRGVCKF